jgi:hypothetical protein
MNSRFSWFVAAAVLASGGCSSSSTPAGATTVDPGSTPLGGVEGTSFTSAEVVTFEDTTTDANGVSTPVTRIVASTVPGVCSRIAAGPYQVAKGEKFLSARFASLKDAKSFTVTTDGDPSTALFDASTQCVGDTGPSAPDKGQGTITISKVGSSVEGVIDLKFAKGQIRGRFTASGCPAAKTAGLADCPP